MKKKKTQEQVISSDLEGAIITAMRTFIRTSPDIAFTSLSKHNQTALIEHFISRHDHEADCLLNQVFELNKGQVLKLIPASMRAKIEKEINNEEV